MRLDRNTTSVWTRALNLLPCGHPLGDVLWNRRHRIVVSLISVYASIVTIVALSAVVGSSPDRPNFFLVIVAGIAPAGLGLLAAADGASHATRADAATACLLLQSAILVYLMHGNMSAHVVFFPAGAAIALYQAWRPLWVWFSLLLAHHVAMGLVWPGLVFGAHHPAHSIVSASLMHFGFAVMLNGLGIAAWKLNEIEALNDQLTGFANRDLLVQRFINDVHRRPADAPASAAIIVHCESYLEMSTMVGTNAADRLLVRMAEVIRSRTRQGEYVGRAGTDHFIVVLPNSTVAQARSLGRVIELDLRNECNVLTASIEVAGENTNPETLYRKLRQDLEHQRSTRTAQSIENSKPAHRHSNPIDIVR